MANFFTQEVSLVAPYRRGGTVIKRQRSILEASGEIPVNVIKVLNGQLVFAGYNELLGNFETHQYKFLTTDPTVGASIQTDYIGSQKPGYIETWGSTGGPGLNSGIPRDLQLRIPAKSKGFRTICNINGVCVTYFVPGSPSREISVLSLTNESIGKYSMNKVDIKAKPGKHWRNFKENFEVIYSPSTVTVPAKIQAAAIISYLYIQKMVDFIVRIWRRSGGKKIPYYWFLSRFDSYVLLTMKNRANLFDAATDAQIAKLNTTLDREISNKPSTGVYKAVDLKRGLVSLGIEETSSLGTGDEVKVNLKLPHRSAGIGVSYIEIK